VSRDIVTGCVWAGGVFYGHWFAHNGDPEMSRWGVVIGAALGWTIGTILWHSVGMIWRRHTLEDASRE
jgi:hypothetical protein